MFNHPDGSSLTSSKSPMKSLSGGFEVRAASSRVRESRPPGVITRDSSLPSNDNTWYAIKAYSPFLLSGVVRKIAIDPLDSSFIEGFDCP